jgi:hypothetical protein
LECFEYEVCCGEERGFEKEVGCEEEWGFE